MVVVAVYGFAILFNLQWLRLAGIYGLFCIFLKSWIMLATWLSNTPTDWSWLIDQNINNGINLAGLAITPVIYYLWQRRYAIHSDKTMYKLGIFASYNLFLIFGFLLGYVGFNAAQTLDWALHGIFFVAIAVYCIFLLRVKMFTKIKAIFYLFLFFLFVYEFMATLYLLQIEIVLTTGIVPFNTINLVMGWFLKPFIPIGIVLVVIAIILMVFGVCKYLHCRLREKSKQNVLK